MNGFKYYLAAFSAFFLWGFFSLALKPIAYVPSFDILFFRLLFASLLVVLFIVLFRRHVLKKDRDLLKKMAVKDKKRTALLTLTGACFLGINWFLFIYVVNQVNVQSASLAYLICPVTTAFLAFLLLKEKLGQLQWIAVLISATGCGIYFMIQNSSFIYAFIVALSYSLYLISQKTNTYFDKFNILAVQLITIFVMTLPYYLIKGIRLPEEMSFYGYVVLIALLFTLIPLYLNLFALKGAAASTVGVLLYINPIITFLIAVFYYKEPVKSLQIVSYLLILLSIILFNAKVILSIKQKSTRISTKIS